MLRHLFSRLSSAQPSHSQWTPLLESPSPSQQNSQLSIYKNKKVRSVQQHSDDEEEAEAPIPPRASSRSTTIQPAQNLQSMQEECEAFTQWENEIEALHEEIASQKRVLQRYRKLLLLPLEHCDEGERRQRLACAYQRSITLGWQSIYHTREEIYKLEQKQKRLMLTPSCS